jgi:predicted  nucleic acid-binding Zn-ribbon protein
MVLLSSFPLVAGCQSKRSLDFHGAPPRFAVLDTTPAAIRLAQTDKAARAEIKDIDKRLAKREKTIGDLNVGSNSDEAAYKRRLAELKAQRTALVESINHLNSGKVP